MKFKLILSIALLIALPYSVTFGADVNPTFEVGSLSSELAYMTGGEINLTTTKSGFTNKIRSGVYEIGDKQGYYAWDISQQVLKDKWWKLYGAFGFGILNEVQEGADNRTGGVMLEVGATLFDKLPFGVGVKAFPATNTKEGEKFYYGTISFNLP